MNYNFAFTCAEYFFNPDSMRISTTEFDKKLKELRKLYPRGVAYASQNLFGSHDSNRIGSHIVNRGIANFRDWGHYFGISQAANNLDYNVRKPNADELELQKLFAIMQMTYVGAPMIYYGDEVGMWGANDPDCRKPMLWSDLKYEDEVYNPDGSKRSPDKVTINNNLFKHYQKLISIRNSHIALQKGSFKTLKIDDGKDYYVFERHYEGDTVWVAINNSNDPIEVKMSAQDYASFKDVLNDKVYQINNQEVSLEIPRKWAVIIIVK